MANVCQIFLKMGTFRSKELCKLETTHKKWSPAVTFAPLGKEIDWFDVSEKYFDFRFLICQGIY